MNNKGFAISAVLYTLLIAFLLFLAVTLAVFKSSARTIGNANNDLIDGKELRVSLVKNVNDYSSKKYGGCDDWADPSTCELGYLPATDKNTFITNNYGCVAKIDPEPLNYKNPAKHYWYEYTECKLTYDSLGNASFDGFDSSNCSVKPNQNLIKIDSVKGPMFWPRDFGLELDSNGILNQKLGDHEKEYKGIKVECNLIDPSVGTVSYQNCEYKNIKNDYFTIRVSIDSNYSDTIWNIRRSR